MDPKTMYKLGCKLHDIHHDIKELEIRGKVVPVAKTTERVVWPVTLGYAETSRLLIGWCELREGFRHFRCDRIQSADILDQPIGLRSEELRHRWQRWRAEELNRLRTVGHKA